MFPAPPCAITGIPLFDAMRLINSLSKPVPVPSLSTEVIINSPAPSSSTLPAQSIALTPVCSLPLSM
jgi:hypothetical protein